MVELKYPEQAEIFVKKQIEKRVEEAKKNPVSSIENMEDINILNYLIKQEGIISQLCQNQHKNQLYIEFLAISIFKDHIS